MKAIGATNQLTVQWWYEGYWSKQPLPDWTEEQMWQVDGVRSERVLLTWQQPQCIRQMRIGKVFPG